MLFSNKISILVAVLSIILYVSMRFYATPLFHQLTVRYNSLLGRMAEEQNCSFCEIVKAEDPEKLIYKVSKYKWVYFSKLFTHIY